MAEIYKVSLEIERVDHGAGEREKVGTPVELAVFRTAEEAQAFCIQLQQDHAARVTGETDLAEELLSPELFTAGD